MCKNCDELKFDPETYTYEDNGELGYFICKECFAHFWEGTPAFDKLYRQAYEYV